MLNNLAYFGLLYEMNFWWRRIGLNVSSNLTIVPRRKSGATRRLKVNWKIIRFIKYYYIIHNVLGGRKQWEHSLSANAKKSWTE